MIISKRREATIVVDQIKIGNFLKELRKEKDKTQEEIAELFGVSSRSVSRWENGNTMPDLGIIVELADYYNVDLRELINGERKSEVMNEDMKDVLKSAADYAEQEKKLTVRRKCIVSIVGTLFFAASIVLGVTLIPTLPDITRNNIDRIFLVIGLIGLVALWSIVIYKNHESKKKGAE